MLLTIEYHSQMIFPNDLVAHYGQDAEKLVLSLAHSMLDNSVPFEILVRDKHTVALLREFAKQIGMSIQMCDDLRFLMRSKRKCWFISVMRIWAVAQMSF